MLKNKNAESFVAVYIHFVCFKTINENKQTKQKGVNILSYNPNRNNVWAK